MSGDGRADRTAVVHEWRPNRVAPPALGALEHGVFRLGRAEHFADRPGPQASVDVDVGDALGVGEARLQHAPQRDVAPRWLGATVEQSVRVRVLSAGERVLVRCHAVRGDELGDPRVRLRDGVA